jgi:hypothetical protein
MGRREPRDDCWFRVVASVSQLERQMTGMDDEGACLAIKRTLPLPRRKQKP